MRRKTRLIEGIPLSQCPCCLTIEMDVGNRVPMYQKSVVQFNKLIKKQCYVCKTKKGDSKEASCRV